MEFAHIARQIAVSAVPILIAITLHEASHGFIADKLGDNTAKAMGRLTLNPIAHIDIFGTVIMPLMLMLLNMPMFGYAKPVPINPFNFKNPKRDMALSAAAGPLTNLLIAFVSVLIFRLLPAAELTPGETSLKIIEPLREMLYVSIIINVVLASFNLIPVPPLDGGRVLMGFLPHKQAEALGKIEPFGIIILIALLATGIAGYIMLPLRWLFFRLLGLN